MKYCKECVLPDMRPGLKIDPDGVCSACKGHKQKDNIDWTARKNEFEGIVKEAREKRSSYDCVIPVSGGKDSTAQVVKCLEYDLKILAVTWRTPARTDIGQKNLDNLIGLGVDHIDFSINPEVERRFTLLALEKYGSTAVPMHMALYTIPLRIATVFNIPLVVWGESPHMEYGGTPEERKINSLDLDWFSKHTILQGTSAEDWVGEKLTLRDLEAYCLPERDEFSKKRIRSVFLGYYFKWDPEESMQIAKKHGFLVRKEGARTGYYNYADIDCDFISVHHYFKWFKFGFTRLFDNLSLEVRNKRISRSDALRIIKETGAQVPHDDIKKICRFLKIKEAYFHKIEEKFRNKDIWFKEDGKWKIKDFLIKDWRWG